MGIERIGVGWSNMKVFKKKELSEVRSERT